MASSLAVILTVYRRPWALPRIEEALRAQTRPPDRLWAVWEDGDDGRNLVSRYHDFGCRWQVLQLLKGEGNPLARAANMVLDLERADYITYLTDDSLPHPEKYERMARALDENPDWNVVNCSQDHGTVRSPDEWLTAGWGGASVRHAGEVVTDPFCRVDHTQVMHRRSSVRWPEDAPLRLSDACFFRELVDADGPMHPVPEVLDWTRQLPDGISRR